jgi:predicted ribosome quality control (RQC) complex YloA/Tae2 family protein
LGVAEEQNWSSRKIAPGLEYLPPPKSEDPREVSLENLMRILSRSEKGLAQSLAKELSLGGVYAEEVCLRSGLEKSRNTSSFSAEEAQKIISTIRELFSETLKPCIVFSSGKMVDIIPVPLYYYSGLQFEVLGSFSEGLERAPIPEHSDDSESQLSRIIEEQQRAFNALIERADSSEKKAELIYSHYNEIKAALDFLREESAESSVSEAFDKLMSRFSFVKAVDKKERRITFEFPE